MSVATPIRIANCSGFFGDRVSAAREMVEGGRFDATSDACEQVDVLLTSDQLRELLPETSGCNIDRHRLSSLQPLNFVIRELLQEQVAPSTRDDPRAKSLGEVLRAWVVYTPAHFAD
jgi:hypothetical protein